jgi:hypothetical protein
MKLKQKLKQLNNEQHDQPSGTKIESEAEFFDLWDENSSMKNDPQNQQISENAYYYNLLTNSVPKNVGPYHSCVAFIHFFTQY